MSSPSSSSSSTALTQQSNKLVKQAILAKQQASESAKRAAHELATIKLLTLVKEVKKHEASAESFAVTVKELSFVATKLTNDDDVKLISKFAESFAVQAELASVQCIKKAREMEAVRYLAEHNIQVIEHCGTSEWLGMKKIYPNGYCVSTLPTFTPSNKALYDSKIAEVAPVVAKIAELTKAVGSVTAAEEARLLELYELHTPTPSVPAKAISVDTGKKNRS
jgi:hypothetical protein